MNKNIIGTLFRIVLLAFILLNFWFWSIAFVYLIITLIINFKFSWFILWSLFLCLIFVRIFYPKNIFN